MTMNSKDKNLDAQCLENYPLLANTEDSTNTLHKHSGFVQKDISTNNIKTSQKQDTYHKYIFSTIFSNPQILSFNDTSKLT